MGYVTIGTQEKYGFEFYGTLERQGSKLVVIFDIARSAKPCSGVEKMVKRLPAYDLKSETYERSDTDLEGCPVLEEGQKIHGVYVMAGYRPLVLAWEIVATVTTTVQTVHHPTIAQQTPPQWSRRPSIRPRTGKEHPAQQWISNIATTVLPYFQCLFP